MLSPRDPKAIPAWDFERLRNAPWLRSLADVVARYCDVGHWPTAEEHTEILRPLALTNSRGMPLRFANTETRRSRRKAPDVVDLSTTYDGHVAMQGIVPTRSGVPHDFFNALSWAAFPKSKSVINRLQLEALTRRIGDGAARVPNARSREEDILTMLDEGGLVLASDKVVLGHALLEHFYSSDAPVRAFAVHLDGASSRESADAMLASLLDCDPHALNPDGRKGHLISAAFESD